MRHTISILVENKFGVLARIAGMFSGRGFNIDTLNVGPTLDATASRMTIVVRGDDKVLEQVIKQLEKLVDVIDVQDFRDEEYVDRELVLLRVRATSKTRSEVMQICDVFRAKIIDVQPETLAIEVTGTEGKMTKFLMLMAPLRHQGSHAHRQGCAAAHKRLDVGQTFSSLCPPRFTPTKTPISQLSKARPSLFSASARRVTPTR
jgi:acetolactate synthase, small subunit